MINENQDLLKGKELLSAAIDRLNSMKITFFAKHNQSKNQIAKIQSIVNQISDKAAGVSALMNFGEDAFITVLYNYTRGNVYWKLRNGEDITDEEIINDLADYLAQEAYLNCARKLLNTNRLDSWICDAQIRLV